MNSIYQLIVASVATLGSIMIYNHGPVALLCGLFCSFFIFFDAYLGKPDNNNPQEVG